MHLFRVVTVSVLTAWCMAGCSRTQPTTAPAPAPAEVQNTPAAPGPAVDDKETPRMVDPLRVKARSVMFVLGYGAYKYKQEHGEFPKSLNLLVAREEDLLDPWGRPYHYAPRESHTRRGVPDIWSEGADPNDPHAVLANWEDGND